jgi:hypothetical protein
MRTLDHDLEEPVEGDDLDSGVEGPSTELLEDGGAGDPQVLEKGAART